VPYVTNGDAVPGEPARARRQPRGHIPRVTAARLRSVGASYREVIRSPRYFALWLGQLVSSFGDTLHSSGPPAARP